MNQSETAVLEGLFCEKGVKVVPFSTPADVAVINSCTVTAAANSDARHAVNRAVRLNPLVRVAIVGCQAQVQKQKLLAWPNVCWVVGTAAKMRLADLVLQEGAACAQRILVPPIRRGTFVIPPARVNAAADALRIRANIKVQDGCDHFCAYCEIPYARGRSRSRAFDNIVDEARVLAAAGYKEVVITGVNVGDYSDSGKRLVDIVKGIEKLQGIERIRISSVEHTKLPLELVSLMHPPHKLCRFLHIPIQSGCDRILQRMGRDYTCAEVGALVRQLKTKVPGLMIGTDIIVGFPGETEADFEVTRAFLERSGFDYFHVFSYSDRERARSRTFKGAVLDKESARRSSILRALSRARHAAFLESLLGTEQAVLVEQKKNEHWVGHTDNYVKIKISPSRNSIGSRELRNLMVSVVLDSVDGEAVVATLNGRCVSDGTCSQDQRAYCGP